MWTIQQFFIHIYKTTQVHRTNTGKHNLHFHTKIVILHLNLREHKLNNRTLVIQDICWNVLQSKINYVWLLARILFCYIKCFNTAYNYFSRSIQVCFFLSYTLWKLKNVNATCMFTLSNENIKRYTRPCHNNILYCIRESH